MSDDYKIQLNLTVNGNLVNVRANSAEELKTTVEELAKTVDDTFSAVAQFKEGVTAKDVFTGGLQGKGNGPAQSQSASVGANGVPNCKHGPMKDLRGQTTRSGQPYKYDYYCSSTDRDNTCKGVKL